MHTPQARQKFALRLVQDAESGLAAVSWKFFTELGRGYLRVVPHLEGTEATIDRVDYLPLALFEAEDLPIACCTSALLEALSTYEPELEFVALVSFLDLTGDADEHWLVHRPAIDPVHAFTAAQQRPSEFGITWERE